MRPPVVLSPLAVDLWWTGPSFGSSEHDHRPERPFLGSGSVRSPFETVDISHHGIERSGHELMHLTRLTTLDKVGNVAITAEEMIQFVATDSGQYGWTCDLVSIQMENGQDNAVGDWVQKFVGVPARRKRTRFRLTVADDAGRNQVRIVEDSSVRM